MTAGRRSETAGRAMTAGRRRVTAGWWCVTARGGIPAALSHDTSSLKNSKPTRRVTETSRVNWGERRFRFMAKTAQNRRARPGRG